MSAGVKKGAERVNRACPRRVAGRLRERELYGLAALVARESHVLLDEMLGPCRTRSVVRGRHELFRRIVALGFSRSEVAALFERDTKTVIDAMRSAA